MKDIHTTQSFTSNYFNWVYKDDVTFDNMPWITWAVDIDLLSNIISDKFWKKLKIFEIWCWIWTESVFLTKMWHNLTSIDLSNHIIKKAKKNSDLYWVNVNFIEFDITNNIEELNIDLWEYDLVIDRACFHHILPVNRDKYYNNILKILRKNGKLYIRWFSDKMLPSVSWDGPYRLSKNDFFKTFKQWFIDFELDYYKNIPSPEKNQKDQIWISFLATKK